MSPYNGLYLYTQLASICSKLKRKKYANGLDVFKINNKDIVIRDFEQTSHIVLRKLVSKYLFVAK